MRDDLTSSLPDPPSSGGTFRSPCARLAAKRRTELTRRPRLSAAPTAPATARCLPSPAAGPQSCQSRCPHSTIPRNCFTIWCSMGPRQIMGLSPDSEIPRRSPSAQMLPAARCGFPQPSLAGRSGPASAARSARTHRRQQADLVSHLGQSDGQVHRQRGLAYSALA